MMNETRKDRNGRANRGRVDSALDPEVEELVELARTLPTERQPERDLWLGIKNRIAHPEIESNGLTRWFFASMSRRHLARATVAVASVIALTSIATLWVSNRSISLDDQVQVRAIADQLRDRDGVTNLHNDLITLLDQRRDELPPEAVAALEEGLGSIDRAIAEIHLTMRRYPDNRALGFLLAEAYRREAHLLERLQWWTSEAPPEIEIEGVKS